MSLSDAASDERALTMQVSERKRRNTSPVLGGYWKLVEHQINQIRNVAVCTAQKNKNNDFAHVVTALTQMLDTFTSWEEANSELDKIYEQLSRYDYQTQQKVLRRKERFKVAKTVVDQQFEKVRSGLELDAHCSSPKGGINLSSRYSGSEIERDLAHLHGMMHEIALLAESIGSAEKEGILVGDIQNLSKYVRMARAMRADKANTCAKNQTSSANTENYNAIIDVIKNGEHSNNTSRKDEHRNRTLKNRDRSNNNMYTPEVQRTVVKEAVILPQTSQRTMAVEHRAVMSECSTPETDEECNTTLHKTHSWWEWISKNMISLARTVREFAENDDDDDDCQWTDEYLYETPTGYEYRPVQKLEINNCNNQDRVIFNRNNQAWLTSSTSYAQQELKDLANDSQSDGNQSCRLRMNLQDQAATNQTPDCAQRSTLLVSQSMPTPRNQPVDPLQPGVYAENNIEYSGGTYKAMSLRANARYQPKSRSKGITFSGEIPHRGVTSDVCTELNAYVDEPPYRESVDSVAGRLTYDLRGPSFSAPSTSRMEDIDEGEMMNDPQWYTDCKPKSSSLGARPKTEVPSRSQGIAMFNNTRHPLVEEDNYLSDTQPFQGTEQLPASLGSDAMEPPPVNDGQMIMSHTEDASPISPSQPDFNTLTSAYSYMNTATSLQRDADEIAQPKFEDNTIATSKFDIDTPKAPAVDSNELASLKLSSDNVVHPIADATMITPSFPDLGSSVPSSFADELLTAVDGQTGDLQLRGADVTQDSTPKLATFAGLPTEHHEPTPVIKPESTALLVTHDDEQSVPSPMAPSPLEPSPVASSRVSDDGRQMNLLLPPPIARRRRRRRTRAWCRCSLLNGLVHAYILMGFVLLVLTIRHNILAFWPMCGLDQITLRHYGVPVF